ncbi:MAG: PEP-CTERM sorting domain-containing protein [Nitrosomonas sp.]|uniref:PEP-CTERM sorting domain-containing protein n=1 Tax=Nitrosomonas sp. TaxID=42353 RepID=UPI0032EE3FA8
MMGSINQVKQYFHSSLVALSLGAIALSPVSAAAETFGSTTDTLLRGSVGGSFPGEFYGGSLSGGFPVVLTEAEARSSVLGAPDDRFLSLPGEPGVSGTAFTGAYIEVGFGSNFSANNILKIWETGDSGESAQLFLWTDNGGNIQPTVTSNAAGVITLDLSGYAGILAGLGATAFTKVGIGGLDVLGASQGFDLDAISISPIPEPSTYALLLAGIAVLGWNVRRNKLS